MKITLNDKKLKVNEWTIQRIEQKLNKLDRYFKSDAVATVRLSEERGRYIAEVTVHAGSMVYRAQDKSGDVIASFDAAVDAIDRQIRKNKTRLEKRLQEGAFEIYPADAPAVEEMPASDGEGGYRVSRAVEDDDAPALDVTEEDVAAEAAAPVEERLAAAHEAAKESDVPRRRRSRRAQRTEDGE